MEILRIYCDGKSLQRDPTLKARLLRPSTSSTLIFWSDKQFSFNCLASGWILKVNTFCWLVNQKRDSVIYLILLHFLCYVVHCKPKLLKPELYSVTNYSGALVLSVLSLLFSSSPTIPLFLSFFSTRAVTSNEAQLSACMCGCVFECMCTCFALFLCVFGPRVCVCVCVCVCILRVLVGALSLSHGLVPVTPLELD